MLLATVPRDTKRLPSSQSRFRNHVETAPVAIFITSPDGRYIEVNPAASELTGYTHAELLNMSISELSPKELSGEHRALFETIRQSGGQDSISRKPISAPYTPLQQHKIRHLQSNFVNALSHFQLHKQSLFNYNAIQTSIHDVIHKAIQRHVCTCRCNSISARPRPPASPPTH